MAKDLIIGGASNYTWDDLKPWVKSIKNTGYSGDIALVVTNITNETIQKLADENVGVFVYGNKTDTGYQANTSNAPHVERFFYLWNYLNSLKDYDNVVVTDTRDVIFQKNPSSLFDVFYDGIKCASEGLLYKDEPWGNKNFHDAFGPFFHDMIKDELIYNVGTISGSYEYVKDLLLMIFQMSINRPAKIVDQAVFNFLIHQEPYKSFIDLHTNKDAYAIQLGTTEHAVKAGAGDIGYIAKNNPTEFLKYQLMYKDEQPIITENGYVLNKNGDMFYIVHQYDRVPELKEKILRRYV